MKHDLKKMLAAYFLVILLFPIFAFGQMQGSCVMCGSMGWGMLFSGLLFLGFLAITIWFVFFLVRKFSSSRR